MGDAYTEIKTVLHDAPLFTGNGMKKRCTNVSRIKSWLRIGEINGLTLLNLVVMAMETQFGVLAFRNERIKRTITQ